MSCGGVANSIGFSLFSVLRAIALGGGGFAFGGLVQGMGM
jgi:hypothetical protein